MFRKKQPELSDNKAVVGKVSTSNVQKLLAPLKKLSKNQKLLILLGFFVVVAIALGFVISTVHSRNVTKENTKKAYETAIQTANQLHNSGQDNYAKQALDDLLSKHSKNLSKEQLQQVRSTMASIQFGLGDSQAAAEQRKLVIDNIKNPSFIDYYNVAHACDTANDKSCAVKYYSLANKSLEDPNNRPPDAVYYSSFISYRLKALEGQ